MKTSLLFFLAVILFIPVFAQIQITGNVIDQSTNQPLPGATVLVKETGNGTITDSTGYFSLHIPEGNFTLKISYVGYADKEIKVHQSENLQISLKGEYRLEEVVIRAIRGTDKTPVTESTLLKKEIEDEYIGQDPLFLMNNLTPSVISYSESGTNISNYGQMRLRGIDQSRINITLDGAPLNDMIDQGVFFSNFIDFANSVESIQIQRGVGTSTNGTASYAGSINFQSPDLRNSNASATAQFMGGSFSTRRASGELKTGWLDHDFAFYTRFTKLNSGGYRYHTSTDSYSFFFSGGFFGKKDMIKLTGFTGQSRNGLAYMPVAISDIREDPRTNYVNENDRDNFGQDFVQLQYTRSFSEQSSWVSSVYYGAAGGDFPSGYYETDSIYSSDTPDNYYISQRFAQINYPLFNRHWGLMTYLNTSSYNKKFNLNAGIHTYLFKRHDLESLIPDNAHPFYDEHSGKNEFSAFIKADYQLGQALIYGDLQLRAPRLHIKPDENVLPGEPEVVKNWQFLNPKIGASYRLNESQDLYAFYGFSGREPTKIDILGGYQLLPGNLESVKSDDVKPEYVHDIEAGYRIHSGKLSGQVNAFYMKFQNEIAPIGKYVPEGFIQLRKNIPSSYRTGIELDWSYNIFPELILRGNTTYMKSRIDRYDPEEDPNVYRNVSQALSPEFMGSSALLYTFQNLFEFEVSGRFMSESYLEPTNRQDLKMPGYFIAGTRIAVHFLKDQIFSIFLNNIFNKQYYTYGAPVDPEFDGITEPGYFIQPPRNIYFMLTLKL